MCCVVRKRWYGDVWAESGGDGSDTETWSRDSTSAVWGDLGALRGDPVSKERHREQTGSAHVCHSHAPEPAQMKSSSSSL